MELSFYTDKLLTDGQTDRHGAYREITLNKSCNAFKFNPSKINLAVPNACQKDGQIELKHLLQFPAQPSSFLGSMENSTFVYIYIPKKSKYLKADFLFYFDLSIRERIYESIYRLNFSLQTEWVFKIQLHVNIGDILYFFH